MRILYCAIDQTVPGTDGGSVHVEAVADGLAALGHDVHVLARPGDGPFPPGGATGSRCRRRLGARSCGGCARRRCALARDLAPDVVIERYYNFGGEGIAAAAATGALAVLEVNAPVIDSRRLAESGARQSAPVRADAAVARAALPTRRSDRDAERRNPAAGHAAAEDCRNGMGRRHGTVSPGRVRPQRRSRVPPARCAVFAGAFRSWHGAVHLVARDAPAAERADARYRRGVHRRRTRTAARARGGRGPRRAHLHRRRAARGDARASGGGRHRRRAVRHRRASRRCRSASTGRRSRSSSTWRRACRSSRRRWISIPTLVGHGREGLLYRTVRSPAALADRAGVRWRTRAVATQRLRTRRGARRGARRATSAGRRTGAALESAIAG